ncbi:MAG: succinyl-diaminopimelate desuccinylase [Gammaproteobacteria bacterium]|nr:succinyl-diaminopimelate desuccinylase [Gammaproteobacteria bacterium]
MMDLITLLKDLTACPSLTPNDAGCQAILTRLLHEWGFKTTALPYQGASNFWATPGSNPTPKLVLAGHTDVVPTGNLDDWRFPPFDATIHENYIYGRGIADMKGSLAAMMCAVEQFICDFPDKASEIGFLITSAEEGPSDLGTPIVLEHLKKQGIHFEYCLVGEPTCEVELGDTIKNGRRGSLTGQLRIQGKQGHIAYPHLASNPIHSIAPFLQEFVRTTWDTGNVYFQPTQMQISNIQAGTGAGNVIPGALELLFNFRYSPQVTAEQLMQKTEEYLNEHCLSYEIEWKLFGEPFLTKPDRLIQALSQSIQTICGITPTLSTTGGTSDARYIAKTGAQVVEFGLLNTGIHQVNEHTLIDDLYKLKNIYYTLFNELL